MALESPDIQRRLKLLRHAEAVVGVGQTCPDPNPSIT